MANFTDKQGNQLINLVRGLSINEFGKSGAKFIDDNSSTAHTEGFYAIQGINSCKLDVSDCTFGDGMVDFDQDFIIPNGTIIYGDFVKISLDSGSCIAYKKA